MQYLLGYLIAVSVVSLSIFLYKNKSKRYRGHYCDILITPGGMYYPTANWQYIYITVDGTSIYFSVLPGISVFDTKEEAMDYLNKWIDLRGKDNVSVWDNVNKNKNEQN